MSEQGVTWVSIDTDFDPVEYANTFADDTVVEAIQNANSPEEQLVCLYENGYLSKREGKMKYLLPNSVNETINYSKLMADAPAKKGRLDRAKEAAGKAYGVVKGKAGQARAAIGAMPTNKKVGAAALSVGGLLAARALYKKMKARKAAQKESFDEQDIEFLVQEATLLGFDIETFEDLDEAINVGAEVDEVLLDADEQGLSESYSEEDILAATFDLSEEEEYIEEGSMRDKARAAKEWAFGRGEVPGKSPGVSARMPGGDRARRAAGAAAASVGREVSRLRQAGRGGKAFAAMGGGGKARQAAAYGRGIVGAMSGKQKVGAALGVAGAALAARALYKRMKARKAAKQNEGLDSWDLQHILTDSQALGFEFDSYDALVETLSVGELVDYGFGYYLGEGEDSLYEGDLDEEAELDVMEALLYDLDEEDVDRMARMASWMKDKGSVVRKAGKQARSGWRLGATQRAIAHGGRDLSNAGKTVMGATGKTVAAKVGRALSRHRGKAALGAAGLAVGAAALAARRRKKKQQESQNESVEFQGYRSSAQGSIYESAPIPYGTGNNLYNRIRKDLLS